MLRFEKPIWLNALSDQRAYSPCCRSAKGNEENQARDVLRRRTFAPALEHSTNSNHEESDRNNSEDFHDTSTASSLMAQDNVRCNRDHSRVFLMHSRKPS
jgi:hypothetical protein